MKPLAFSIRPKEFNEVIGHSKVKNIMETMIKNDKLFSLIIYGEPGLGKTTLAEIFVNKLTLPYYKFNASTDNKAMLKQIADESYNYGCVLILDELHRMKKDIQDFLLPYLESGKIILVGLTTENPYYSVNPAIRSRCHIFKLNKPSKEEIVEYLKVVSNKIGIILDDNVYDYIIKVSNSEIRSAINILELIAMSNAKDLESIKSFIGDESLSLGSTDQFYDLLSAFQKSIRGSDVDASIYYLAKLLLLEDIPAICRRLSVIAYEDIGLADPMMGVKVDAAIHAVERIGFPEGRIPLAQIVIEMALSPKSNSAYSSLDKALQDIKNGNDFDSPNHLKNGMNKDTYKYPFDYQYNIVKQRYLPKEVDSKYLELNNNSKNESMFLERLIKINKLLGK